MHSPQLRRFIQWQRMIMALFGVLFGLVLSVLSDWLVNQGLTYLPWIIVATLIIGLVGLVVTIRRPPGIEVAIRSPLTIRTETEARQYARRGFVGFVPLYKAKRDTAAAQLTAEARAAAVEAGDFDCLQVEDSNLQPTIEAILRHASRLEHCWLLATDGPAGRGSAPYAPLLARYLREKKGLTCRFYYGAAYTISLDDDALVLSKTYDQVQSILKQAHRLGLLPREVVADITTGFRSMTLGIVLACLDGDQDLEFVGTHYNQFGQPEGALFPIIFSFEPTLLEA